MKSARLVTMTSLLLLASVCRQGRAFDNGLRHPPISVAEQYLLQAANTERRQRGLPPLEWDGALFRAAAAHADEMARHGTISHQFLDEPELSSRGKTAGAHFSVISENVAMAGDAVTIHDLWMHSPGHRANLLDREVDHVGIRVVQRGRELFAVEDFEHAVESLSQEDQEQRVAALVTQAAPVRIVGDASDARRTCAMESGYAGQRRPFFVMRFTAGDLNRLPDELERKLASGRYRTAAVGACTSADTQNFTAYDIAVLLYP